MRCRTRSLVMSLFLLMPARLVCADELLSKLEGRLQPSETVTQWCGWAQGHS